VKVLNSYEFYKIPDTACGEFIVDKILC